LRFIYIALHYVIFSSPFIVHNHTLLFLTLLDRSTK